MLKAFFSILVTFFTSIMPVWAQEYIIDFTIPDENGSSVVIEDNNEVIALLSSKGFTPQQAAKNDTLPREKIALSVDPEKGLTIALRQRSAFRLPVAFVAESAEDSERDLLANGAQILEIEWRADQHPAGWSNEIIRQGLLITIEFSTPRKRRSSGFLSGAFAPQADDFLAFALCSEKTAFRQGKMYKKQGRYICIDAPALGEEVTTQIDLKKSYEEAFGRSWGGRNLPISSIGVAAYNHGYGPTKASIKRLSLSPNE